MSDTFERLAAALGGRYRIEEEIGRGGMGSVYRAHDLKHDRPVAIKVLPPELAGGIGLERFHREVETAARLAHPHILPVHDSGAAGELIFYVMPFVAGETLRARIEREGRLPIEDAVRLGAEVADALDYAHRQGVIHRDIKPENILLAEGHAVVADFGIARAMNLAGAPGLTGAGVAVGTPLYMSPEQALGDPALDGRSDLYSLGCVIYEVLSGQPPFTGPSAERIVRQHLNAAALPVGSWRRIPPALSRAVERAMAKSPEDRFATGRQFADALRAAGTGPGATGTRRVWQWVVAAVAAALLAAAGWQLVVRRGAEGAQLFGTIAVLPLENLAPDSGQEYFADGMTEAIITHLAQIGALRVISRTSVMQYKGVRKPLREIARELGVDAVVEGTVLRVGRDVRITAQLIEASTDRHLWAETYQRELEDVLGLQMEVARAVAHHVQVTLSPVERARLTSSRVVLPEAYEAYLRGRFHWNTRTPAGFRAAIREFRRAIELDSTYALPYSGLADSHILLVEWQLTPPAEGVPLARAAANEALARDSLLAEGWTSLGEVRIAEWDWEGAEQAFRRAIALNPGYPTAHQWYGYFLSKLGRHDEAIGELQRALQLDPLSRIAHTELARVYWHARRYEQALVQLDRVWELDSTFVDVAWMRGHVLERMGRYDEAIVQFRMSQVGFPVALDLARVYAATGRRAEARRLLAAAVEQGRRDGRYVSPAIEAEVYAALGEHDRAFALLETLYAAGVDDRLTYLKVIPTLDPLRDDPRYDELLRRLKFP